jgi:hypothetical protein
MAAMTASIAHELNQPLSAIVSNANAGLRWLARPQPNIEEVQAGLNRIANDGHRASEVIASIRAMFGKDQRKRAPVNINALIGEVLALLHGELESHQVLLRTDLLDGIPEVMAERVPLQQVLLNLIMNAVDAMNSVADRERRLTIRSELLAASDVRIAVEDSGTGIDPSHTNRIFEAFFTTKPHGMGMGLSICQSIVEAHGGSLWAARRSPHGTVFVRAVTPERWRRLTEGAVSTSFRDPAALHFFAQSRQTRRSLSGATPIPKSMPRKVLRLLAVWQRLQVTQSCPSAGAESMPTTRLRFVAFKPGRRPEAPMYRFPRGLGSEAISSVCRRPKPIDF